MITTAIAIPTQTAVAPKPGAILTAPYTAVDPAQYPPMTSTILYNYNLSDI